MTTQSWLAFGGLTLVRQGLPLEGSSKFRRCDDWLGVLFGLISLVGYAFAMKTAPLLKMPSGAATT